MAYYNFYLLGKIFHKIFSFIKKHKFITLFILFFIIFGFKKCFCIEYLQDSYPNMDFSSYVTYDSNEGVYKFISDINSKSYCTDYMILYGTTYGRFNIIFFPEGLYFNNNSGKGRLVFPSASYTNVPAFAYNYINIEYNADGTLRNVTGHAKTSGFDGWWEYIVYSTCTINDQNGVPIILEPQVTRNPSILNTDNQLSSLDFENLIIDPGTYDNTLIFRLYDTTENKRLLDIYFNDGDYDEYLEREDLENPFSNLVYKIPLSVLPSISYVINHSYNWQLLYDTTDNQKQVNRNITSTVTMITNEVTNGDIQNSINETNNKIDETNEKLDELNDTITDDDISSVSATDLPSISINDPTENGIGTIFQNMYNAFCTGQPQDIVFPIPFTNQSITLHSNYIQQMLHNHNGDWALTFIQAFWAFIFGRFVILDMASKIMKIKSGNIENLQETNIKMEMM